MKELIQKALKNGGITLSKYHERSYKEGYQIAKNDTKKIALDSDYFYEIVENEINKRNGYCGLYVTYDQKYLCVETSQHFTCDRILAFEIGKERRQESILEWKTMKYLYMNESINQ